jgi:hypothetical protein
MLILFDQGTPRGIARALVGHTVKEARAQGWDTLENGELLAAAEVAGFHLFLTTDKNIQHQQNLRNRKIAIVVLSRARWRLIRPRLADILAAVNAATPGRFTVVEIPDSRLPPSP